MDTPQQPPHAQPTRTHHHPPQPIASQSHRPCLPPPPPPPPPAPTARPQPPAQLIFPPTSNTIAQTTPDLESLRLALCPPSPAEHSPPQHPTGPYLYDQSPRHRRSLRKRSLLPRQSLQGNGSGPSADGYPSCTAVSNAILSCFPEPHTLLVQHNWSKFIWNNNYPSFIGSKFVDIYLYNANSENPVANWTEIPNDRGMIGIYADDSWFPPLTSWQAGRNLTFPYFFVITTAGAALTGGEQHQATFRVVQTAPPQAFITASLASVSSQLVASLASHSFLTPSATPNSNLQPGSSGDAFPRWEIALIVVLGSFALLIFLVAAYLAFTNARKRRQVRIWQAAALGGKSGSGGSVASHSPMIQNTEGAALIGHPKSRGGGGALGVTSARDLHSPNSSRPGSPLSAHNAPTNTFAFPPADHHHPAAAPGSEAVPTPDGPITSVDATIMADAFRKALRKPEFALPDAVPPGASARLPEPPTTAGHPPPPPPPNSAPAPPISVRESMHAQVLDEDQMGLDGPEDDELDGDEAKEIMDRELASEGRSMTSVDNRKRPQVHG